MSLRKPEIKDVQGCQQEAVTIIKNLSTLWSLQHKTTAVYKLRVQGVTPLHVSDDRFQIHTFLLEGIPWLADHLKLVEPYQPLKLPQLNKNFQHITTWMKLQWFMQLHAACSELDYKLCGITRLMTGLLRVITSQCLILPSDSIFTDSIQPGSVFLNLNSFLDDVIDGLSRSMGGGWGDFLAFVKTCGPYRICNSKVDQRPAKVYDCEYLQNVVDDIYVAYLLRLPAEIRLMDIVEDLRKFGLRQPHICDLNTSLIEDWKKAPSRGSAEQRVRKCQRQAIHVIANVEMRNIKTMKDRTSEPEERAEWEAIEEICPKLFKVLLVICRHHITFPEAWRDRLFENLPSLYSLSKSQLHDLAIARTVNYDNHTLNKDQLNKIQEKCIEQLCWLDANVYPKPRTLHLRLPATVCRAKETQYVEKAKLPTMSRTASEPFFKPFHRMTNGGGINRQAWKIPMQTGPFTWDGQAARFRNKKYFSEALTLGYE